MKMNSRMFASASIFIVFLINIQAGILFFIDPDKYVGAYNLSGIPGEAAVAGTGLLFIMWNVPYLFAFLNPIKYRSALIQAIIMQGIGVAGESLILTRIPEAAFPQLFNSIVRFLIFDAAGLLVLVGALFLTSIHINNKVKRIRPNP